MSPQADHAVAIVSEADIVLARQGGRRLAAELGFSSTDQTLLATAISELARNIVQYAGSGELLLATVQHGYQRGIHVTACDRGPGIVDKEMALRDGYSTGGSLGLGLPGTRRLADDFTLESEPGRGTTVTFTMWLR